ncbi:MAG: hypothetical protein Q4F60_02760, partial [Candidatus Saccharibacteria bacterium]|nr:hypothetical protein [Candidatus Saccharibacteria bacterium]
MSYENVDLFAVATIIAMIVRRVILQTMTRTVISRTPRGITRKFVCRPARSELRLVGGGLVVALFIVMVIIAAFCYAPVGLGLESWVKIFPRCLTAAVFFTLFEWVIVTDYLTVRRLVRRNEDRLRAEYLRQKEWKDSGKEIMP